MRPTDRLGCALALQLAMGGARAADAPKPAAAPAPVAAAPAEAPHASALDKREIRAQLLPRRYTTLAAEIGAKVSRLPVAEGGRFRAGETLIAFDETGKTYPVKVQRIGAKVDPVSQSVKISAVIDGKFTELIAGMSGKVPMAPQGR